MSVFCANGRGAYRNGLRRCAVMAVISIPLTAWATAPSTSLLRHGRYLVRDVGMCADCHTPRDRHGKEIVARWLRGGPLNFKPAHPIPEWARHSSDLIHLARRWTTQQWIRFLRSGIAPNGKPARPPMPDIHLSYYDSRAVTAYIRSLKH